MRSVAAFFLSLVLLVSLLVVAFSTSSNIAFSHPDKLESWLNQSKFYDHFVATVADEIQKSANSNPNGQSAPVNAALLQATTTAFSPQLLQQSVNTFLNSNYTWLEGKASSPSFAIDLTVAKQNLAQQIGQYVQTRLAGLPACTPAQAAQIAANPNNIDYLSIPCLPTGLTPQVAAAQAVQQINGGDSLLSNPVITADSISPKGNNNQGKPYYKKFSAAPGLYRLSLKLPWIFGILALLSTLGIVFAASRKRKGVKYLGIVLLVAGIILMVVKLVSDSIFNLLEKHIFNNSTVGQLQQSLTDFLHRVETQLVKVDFWFGAAFLILALLLFGILWFTRQKSGSAKSAEESTGTPQAGETPQFPELKHPPKPKRPRLIQ